MIKSWIDIDGTRHYADEHSKAYLKRAERSEPEKTGVLAAVNESVAEKAPRRVKPAEESSS